jgi:hypothetical protein
MSQDRTKPRYDRKVIKSRAAEVAAHYLGSGKDEGARIVWDCPACKKERKLSLRKQDQLFGCFNEDCELGRSADIFSFISHLEGLNEKTQFVEVLKRGYEILGLEGAPKGSPMPEKPQRPQIARQKARSKRDPEAMKRRLELCYQVYARILTLCPLEARVRKYLRTRGLSYDTIRRGRFGSMSAERARYVKGALLGEFGEEKLLSLPGFSKDKPSGRISFTLSGDYLLIPYYERQGNITTIEGRTMGEVPKGMGKYASLRGSGNHLYLFPGTDPEKIAAFTEGPFGAIVAAESGLAVGSVQGCERYKASFSSFAPDGEEGEPLLEVREVNFRSRKIPYIPDADDPPRKNVIEAAPKAAHHLIERQGGKATLCTLPMGMDLDEWLLSMPKERRHRRFLELISGATPLERAEEWKRAQRGETADRKKGPRRQQARTTPAQRQPAMVTGPPISAHIEPNTATGDRESSSQDIADEETAEHPRRGGSDETTQEGEEKAAEKRPRRRAKNSIQPTGAQRLRDAVYRKLLERCPPKQEHKVALTRRGVIEEAVKAGRLGSLDPERTVRASEKLKEEFGAKRLLCVPGFETSHSGKVSLSLPQKEEYVLLPCFYGRGLVAGIEVLRYDPQRGDLVDPDRTVPLSGAGAHLYVFAPYSAEEIEGFCEGPLGAILAAQEDVVLGAVGHFRRYAAGSDPTENEEQSEAVLPELEGIDFGGRAIAYVPKAGPGEENARAREAHNACRYLVERQDGIPLLVFPSSPEKQNAGDTGAEGGERRDGRAVPTSLAEWILALPEGERQGSLRRLFAESPHRRSPSPSKETGARVNEAREVEPTREETLNISAFSVLGMVLLMVAVAAGLDALLGRLEAFGQYVGIGYGSEPIVERGLVGLLREITRSAPLEFLYALRKPVCLLSGIAVGTWCLTSRMKLLRLSAHLSRFREGPWRAHQIPEERKQARTSSTAPLTPREVLEGATGAGVVFVLIRLVLVVAQKLYGVAGALGMGRDTYKILFENSGRLAIIAALICGLYVLTRRIGQRKQRTRLNEGRLNP